MDKDIIEIIDLLTSNELPTISQGLNELNNLLSSLIPFIKQYQTTSSISSKLEQFENLQNSFQYNLAQHLVPLYSYDLNVDQFLLCNKLLQGLLLIHPNSRSIFNLSKNMKYVIDLLESNLNIKLTISIIYESM